MHRRVLRVCCVLSCVVLPFDVLHTVVSMQSEAAAREAAKKRAEEEAARLAAEAKKKKAPAGKKGSSPRPEPVQAPLPELSERDKVDLLRQTMKVA